MRKRLLTSALALIVALSAVGVSAATTVKCTVASVKGATVTLNCGDKADKLAVGAAVKVRPAKKKAIEGC